MVKRVIFWLFAPVVCGAFVVLLIGGLVTGSFANE
jgi:hypothetical protein